MARAFTLIELLVTIAIIGILAALLLTALSRKLKASSCFAFRGGAVGRSLTLVVACPSESRNS